MDNKSHKRLFDTINEIVSSTNSVVNRSTNTSNVSGLGSVSGTDGGGVVYKPIKPTTGTHISKVPGMKKPGRVGFGWIADLSVVVQMLKNAGIEADDDDDPRTLFQSLNRAKTIQQIAVADKMAKLTGTSIDRNTMLSDFQTALDVYDKSVKEFAKHSEAIAEIQTASKNKLLGNIWGGGDYRTDKANDAIANWRESPLGKGDPSTAGLEWKWPWQWELPEVPFLPDWMQPEWPWNRDPIIPLLPDWIQPKWPWNRDPIIPFLPDFMQPEWPWNRDPLLPGLPDWMQPGLPWNHPWWPFDGSKGENETQGSQAPAGGPSQNGSYRFDPRSGNIKQGGGPGQRDIAFPPGGGPHSTSPNPLRWTPLDPGGGGRFGWGPLKPGLPDAIRPNMYPDGPPGSRPIPRPTLKPGAGVMKRIAAMIAAGMSYAAIAAALGITLAVLLLWLGITKPGVAPTEPELDPDNPALKPRYPGTNPMDDPSTPGIDPTNTPVHGLPLK